MSSDPPVADAAPALGAALRAGELVRHPAMLALRGRWPGVLLCGVIALAASFIARLHGGPQLVYALLFGISFHFLHYDAKVRPGIVLCTGVVLRTGE